MITVEKQNNVVTNDDRQYNLNSLSSFQELYVEWLVAESTLYFVFVNNIKVGYLYITHSKIIVEFFLADEYISSKEDVFKTVLAVLKPKKAYVKTFDFVFMACCNMYQKKSKPIGLLFRRISEEKYFTLEKGIHIRIADDNDLLFLKSQKSGLYENEDELIRLITNKNIIMYFLGEDLIGCGFLIRVNEMFDYYDIGMWVNPGYRNKGYAKQIIGNLKEKCIQEKKIPICGCAIENVGSRKTLEANGMKTIHQLVEYKF